MSDEFSLERIIPDQFNTEDAFDLATLQLHLDRYAFAIEYSLPGSILDIACGTGYGAYQIIQSEKFNESHITAVDISQVAIEYGRERYAHPLIEFICTNAIDYTSENLYDTIISLETIEHLKDPESFVINLNSLLKKDGILVVSAPVTPSTDGNPHHFSDFTPAGFRKLFEERGFLLLGKKLQVQSYSISNLFQSKNKRLAQTRRHLGRFYLENPGIFFSRIRSLLVDGLKNKYLTLALRKG